jgi:cation transport regulator
MPITQDKAPKNLPSKAKEIWTAAFNSAYDGTCKSKDDRDECSAKIAWSAVKSKFKKQGDTWTPKSIQEFSLHIYRASFDKSSQTRRWFATASDTQDDSYNDNMTLELYEDFLSRIESNELPPERHRSDFWSGGMPYLSISHYLDLNGQGVPGEVETVYVDGDKLKAKGIFYDTSLGRKCFESVCSDLYSEEKSDADPVRISIAFVDWGHRHKSDGYEFVRESLDDICPECIRELLTGKSEGKEFLKGHLIHLAMTRVPVNERTDMEAQMVTQMEDAKSIVGEDEAEKLEELATEVGKADLVIKSDTDDEPVVEKAKDMEEDEEEEDEDEKKKKKKKDEEKAELEPVENDSEHPLDELFAQFRSSFDEIVTKGFTYEQTLVELQSPFEVFAEEIKSLVQTPEDKQKVQEIDMIESIKSIVSPLQEAITALSQEVSILKQQSQAVTHTSPSPKKEEIVRRSYQPLDPMTFLEPAPSKKPSSIDEIVRRSVIGK